MGERLEQGLLIVALVALAGAATGSSLGAFELVPGARAATTHDVDMIDFAFSPQDLVVEQGDTVVWHNVGAFVHTATDNGGMWDTGDVAPGGMASITFNDAGSFPYYCIYHGTTGGAGMAGTITVNAPVPIPELATFALAGIGLLALGGVVLLRRGRV